MYQNPDIIATAMKPEAEAKEDLMKSSLSYAFDKTDALTENRIALFDMFFAGYCAVEVDHLTEDRGGMDLLPTEQQMEKRKGLIERVKGKLKKPKTTDEAEANMAKEEPPKEDPYSTNEHTYIRRWD